MREGGRERAHRDEVGRRGVGSHDGRSHRLGNVVELHQLVLPGAAHLVPRLHPLLLPSRSVRMETEMILLAACRVVNAPLKCGIYHRFNFTFN